MSMVVLVERIGWCRPVLPLLRVRSLTSDRNAICIIIGHGTPLNRDGHPTSRVHRKRPLRGLKALRQLGPTGLDEDRHRGRVQG